MDDGEFLSHAQFTGSKLDLRLQLNHSGRYIASQVRAQDAGRGLFEIGNLAKVRIRTFIYRETKIRVIEYIKELETDPQRGTLPSRNYRALHNGKISVEVSGSAETIAPLGERHSGSAA